MNLDKENKRALFIDRDGVFHQLTSRPGRYKAPRNWDEVEFNEAISEISKVRDLGYRLIMITNQPEIELGLVPKEFVCEVNEYYRRKFCLDGVYFSPYKEPDHPWRKPNPGMLIQASKDFDLFLKDCFFLGDTSKDVKAAERAGCSSIIWDREYNQNIRAQHRVSSVSQLLEIL